MKRGWRERRAAGHVSPHGIVTAIPATVTYERPPEVHTRDRLEVGLTPALEEALRKAGPLEPALTLSSGAEAYGFPLGTQMYGVCLATSGPLRWAVLSTVPPLDDKETCPICGSRDFEQTTIGFMPWCPDPNKRTCRCGAKWRLCGNDLPVVEVGA